VSVPGQILGLRTDGVWRDAGLADLPAVAEDAPYRDERLRLRFQAAVFQGWTAWQLQEYPGRDRERSRCAGPRQVAMPI
jgi:hypothetical protein